VFNDVGTGKRGSIKMAKNALSTFKDTLGEDVVKDAGLT
jgi:hypothetical protein